MKLFRLCLATLALTTLSISAGAAYDSSWYMADFWSGEYPNGFAVVKNNVSVPARATMDIGAPASIDCKLPHKAVFHPWNDEGNEKREATYITASKILKMTAKEDFTFETYEGEKVELKKGDLIEYLIYGAEGMFFIRIHGVEYEADQDLLEKVDQSVDTDSHQDEWLNLTCAGGERAWILFSDLFADADEGEYIPGLGTWSLGMRDYGEVTDLTDSDLAEKGK